MTSREFLTKTVEGTVADVFTINGYKMHGKVVKIFDDMLLVQEDSQYKCVMMSAISTIVPGDAVRFVRKM